MPEVPELTSSITGTLQSLLSRGLEQFGDRFSIKHLPVVVQNGKSHPRSNVDKVFLILLQHRHR